MEHGTGRAARVRQHAHRDLDPWRCGRDAQNGARRRRKRHAVAILQDVAVGIPDGVAAAGHPARERQD